MKMQVENDAASRRMEEKLLEMEERRDRENREFQLQMMAILAGQTQTPGHNYFPFNNYTYPFIPPPSHSQPAPQSQPPPQSQPSHSQLPHSQDNYDEFISNSLLKCILHIINSSIVIIDEVCCYCYRYLYTLNTIIISITHTKQKTKQNVDDSEG